MTLLERFNTYGFCGITGAEIRRALAIAQAVEDLDRLGTDEAPDWIKRRADELLEEK